MSSCPRVSLSGWCAVCTDQFRFEATGVTVPSVGAPRVGPPGVFLMGFLAAKLAAKRADKGRRL